MSKINFEVEYLSFDKNFEINDNGISYVVYGSNGMGKSSIYNAIKRDNPNFDYIDYGDMKYSILSGKAKEINVTPYSLKYNELLIEKLELEQQLNITEQLKKYDLTSAAKVNDYPQLKELQKTKKIVTKLNISEKNYGILNELLIDDLKFLLKFLDGLKTISDIDEDIKTIKEEYLKTILISIEEKMDDNCSVCPVCNSDVVNLKEIINTKIKEFKIIKTELLRIFKSENIHSKDDDVLFRFEDLVKTSKIISDKEIVDFMFIPEYKNLETINKVLEKESKINIEINSVKKDMIQSYDNLMRMKDDYIAYISRKFGVEVVFSDKDHSIKIKLLRHPKEYSTGEFNLILFATKIFEYVGSDKKLIVLDDPISSYDITNQYKIGFDIVSSNRDSEKNFLIFTHNMNLINLLNSQKRGSFGFKALDKIDNIIYLYDINAFAPDSILNISVILQKANDSIYKKYVQLAIERDNDKVDPMTQNQIHKIFHYDNEYVFDLESHELFQPNLSNTCLLNLVEELTSDSFDKYNFIELSVFKISLMLGLRVWIEKKLFDFLATDSSYINKQSLGDKINYALPKDSASRVESVYPNLTRSDLMGRKVMLNQHEHYMSQGEPFHFVLNLCVDDIFQEIIEIKKLFN